MSKSINLTPTEIKHIDNLQVDDDYLNNDIACCSLNGSKKYLIVIN